MTPPCRFPFLLCSKDVTDGATVGVAQSLQTLGANGALIDLGSALNLALSAGEGFSAAVVAGTPVLTPAENATFVENLWAGVCETARQVGVVTEGAP